MLKLTLPTFAACLLALSLIPNSAQAQSRVFVAAQGNDANPCTFALPCRTFQHAHDTVAAGGEIDVLDPAGYGALTINKAISIQGHGFAGLAVPSGNGITIGAGTTDEINLRGLLLDGIGTGVNGIVFNGGASLNIQDCLIRNFSASGVLVQPSTGFVALAITNSEISDHGANGITVTQGITAAVDGVLNHVSLHHNGFAGLNVVSPANNSSAVITVIDSVASRNGTTGNGAGFLAQSSGTVATILLLRSAAVSNFSNGIVAFGSSGAFVWVSESSVWGNNSGWLASSGGVIYTYGNNLVDYNASNEGPQSARSLK